MNEEFYTALKFLENYGFKYSREKYKDSRACFLNEHGDIGMHCIRLDANFYLYEVYVSINGWKKVIDVNQEFKKICRKRFRSFYYKLNYIIQNQINEHGNIYGLKK